MSWPEAIMFSVVALCATILLVCLLACIVARWYGPRK